MSGEVEWRACRKRPIVVHVRDQRPDEQHVSTREGITPVKPDDLIMRGVQGEEYPIGRELFEQTYDLVNEAADAQSVAAGGEVARVIARLRSRMGELKGGLEGSWVRWQHDTYARIVKELEHDATQHGDNT